MTKFDWISVLMPSVVAVLYFITAIVYLFKKDYAWAIVWMSYTTANIGLIFVGLKK